MTQEKALLIDIKRCIGCLACETACKQLHGFSTDPEPVLSDTAFTVVEARGDKFVRKLCMHCEDPACASACPVGAIGKTPLGPVVYNADICLGCRYCVQACPFGIPKYEWTSLKPRVRKCNFCADRLAQGKINACAEACPYGATIAGDREALLKEARSRMAAEPGKYVPKIFGEHDAGGTSVLMLSSIPFAAMGLPVNLPDEPMPLLTFRVLSKIPPLVAVGASVLTGLWWFTRRKEAVARAEGRVPATVAACEDTPQ